MAARQFTLTDEQRAFVVLKYEKYKAYKAFIRIGNDFEKKFPGSRVPTKVRE